MKKYLLPLLLFFPYITHACGSDGGVNYIILAISFSLAILESLIISGILYQLTKWTFILLKKKRSKDFIWIFYIMLLYFLIFLGQGSYHAIDSMLLCG